MSGILRGIFGLGRDDDYERKLRNISKEESSLLARIQGRSNSSSRAVRLLLFSSFALEVVAISYAIAKLRSSSSDWSDRIISILPVLVLPGLTVLCYWTIHRLAKILNDKDQKKLERLQAQRQAKIDELKQRTNFYAAQQLIQRYDPDPMTQAAAASIFGSKSVANSDSQASATDETLLARKSSAVESGNPIGLRKRPVKGSPKRDGESGGSSHADHSEITPRDAEMEVEEFINGQIIVDHYDSTAAIEDCGWITRITSLLVGEDRTESCPLICGNCHKHNGLATKEDFPTIMYYCPHCHAFNRPKNMEKATDFFGSSDKSSLGKDIGGNVASDQSITQGEELVPSSSSSSVFETEENASKDSSLPTID
ncbi:hypothetical protein MLD38_005972 [Melastoma candidum]|uniref:Uncharacterized protein n=1 Tax=Melastoma candidum TaxID=119954 RepID=A0ACB9RL47_9MYRT|nr:hypothetical protein MLD38_005972 [Melastoma candidum]